jgi:hypothetical protein
LVIVAIQTLLAVSNANQGLASASALSSRYYLWTYGPTAVFVLIAAVWSRVEYQSKLIAPWVRLSKPGAHPKRTLLLDYVSDFPVYVVFKALRNRDFTVSIASTVAVIIKALVVISTGLITLSWTKTWQQSWPMTTQDRFVDSNTGLSNSGDFAYYVMRGLFTRNLTFPDGISSDYAFQSVSAGHLPDDAEASFTVDGLQNSLECQPTEATLSPNRMVDFMNWTVTSPDCYIQNFVMDPSPSWNCKANDTCNVLFGRFAFTQCDGITGDSGKRVLVLAGNLTYIRDRSSSKRRISFATELHQSAQILCVPTYNITKVGISQNGTQTKSVRALSGAAHWTLGSVTAWDIMNTHHAVVRQGHRLGPDRKFPTTHHLPKGMVDADERIELALAFGLANGLSINALFDPKSLERLAIIYYRQFAAILAKQSLMEPTSEAIQGFVVIWGDRLVIRSWAAQWMAGLAAACVLLTALAGFIVPRHGILPCSPSTLAGMASLVARSRDLLEMLRFSGAADAEGLGRPLLASAFRSGAVVEPIINPATNPFPEPLVDPVPGRRHFAILREHHAPDGKPLTSPQISSKKTHPMILHPASRLVLCLLLVGLIVTLELTLRKSNRGGLGGVGDDTYIHYTWTAIPAVAFGALSMTFSSMDFSIRSLAPYTALKKGVAAKTFLALDLIDQSIPRTIFNEIKFGNMGGLAATAAFLITSVFTILSASLYQPLAVPTTIPITLRANLSFQSIVADNSDALASASLILGSNLSYPDFTYADLAFPRFVPTISLPTDGSVNASTVSIYVVVPAVRAKLDCRVYDSSKIRTNLTRDYKTESGTYENPLGIHIEGEECLLIPSHEVRKYNNFLTTRPNMTYFGLGEGAETILNRQGCSSFLYTWGKLDFTADPIVQHVAAVGCNEIVETVSVLATFTGTTLAINPQDAPWPLDDTARPNGMEFREQYSVDQLGEFSTAPNHLEPFFAFLTSSPWAIPLHFLGDPSATPAILAAIKHQHGIMRAQIFAQAYHHQDATMTNVTLSASFLAEHPNATDDMPIYTGTATTPHGEGRRIVTQNSKLTRILQALLGFVLVLVLVGWVVMHETDVLPRPPTTIASVVALLAGGNLFEVGSGFGGGGEKSESESEGEGDNGGGGQDEGGSGNEGEKRGWVWGQTGEGGAEKWPLKGVRFWMGWGTVTDWEGREVGGGENEGGVSRFGIFVLPDEQAKGEDGGEASLMTG